MSASPTVADGCISCSRCCDDERNLMVSSGTYVRYDVTVLSLVDGLASPLD